MNHKLTQVYNQIPQSTCPPNCGKCCGILYPSLAELTNVKDWCLAHHREFKDFTMLMGDNCPYLSETKECEIYPVRPFLCRIMGTSVDCPCPLHLNKPKKILNRPQSLWCYNQIYLRGKEKPRTEKHRKLLHEVLGDIR